MMIGFSTLIYDAFGHINLNASVDSKTNEFQRRVTRTATLDGNASIIDMGYAPADSTFNIKLNNISADDISNLERIVKTHSLIIITTRSGAFKGVINMLNTDNYPIEFTFLVKQKVSE